jgi:hypothetical protein
MCGNGCVFLSGLPFRAFAATPPEAQPQLIGREAFPARHSRRRTAGGRAAEQPNGVVCGKENSRKKTNKAQKEPKKGAFFLPSFRLFG